MGRLSKKHMEELREHCSLGCEYSGTKEIVSEMVTEVLIELGSDLTCGDEIGLTNDEEFATLDDFVRAFWGKAVEAILNVVETQNQESAEDVVMTVKNFLKMHEGGVACVSIQQEPYNYDNHRYTKTYFEEVSQEDVFQSERFKEIANKQVDHFNVIGGGMYKVELCIYLKED